MEKDYLISIILPVYNGDKFLDKAIESCLYQSYENFELIIVNDCSSDDSLKIANGYLLQDSRVEILDNGKNLGLPASLNIGHGKAQGDYLTWTSDDNILKKDCLEILLDNITKENVDVVFSDYDIINNDSVFVRLHKAGPIEHQMFGNKVGASFLYKKEVFKVLNGYNESLFLIEDFDFWIRASRLFEFYHIPKSLYKYRVHDNSLTSKISESKGFSDEHISKIKLMYNEISTNFKWNEATKNIIIDNYLGKKIDVKKYLKNKNIIQQDIQRYFYDDFDCKIIKEGLLLVVRNQLIRCEENYNLDLLLHILLKEYTLLFHPSFSYKVTFNYLKKVFF